MISQNADEFQPEKDEDAYSEDSPGEYNLLTDEELTRLMDEAVKSEDYERAAALKSEIDKRKKRK